jgi:hypothetical protein
MTDNLIPAEGISRRDMLKRSAIVGGAGALVWAAPSVTQFGGRAFGDNAGTPVGKGISYIALQYECFDADGNSMGLRYIKFENYSEGDYDGWQCETGDFGTPGCFPTWDNSGAETDDNECGRFLLTVNAFDDGEPVSVTVTFRESNDCVIVGNAYGKCGAPGDNNESGGECISREGTKSVTFDMCGV